MGLFDRLKAGVGEKLATDEGAPIDPSGTHAVLPMTSEVYHQGVWVTLPAGKVKIDYQVNMVSMRGSYGHLDIPFELTIRSAEGHEVEIERSRNTGATLKDMGDAFTRTTYGKIELPAEGHYFVQAAGQKHLQGEPHLRFV